MNSDQITQSATAEHPQGQHDQLVEQTVERYKDPEYAERYHQEYTGGLKPKHIRSRIISACETSAIRSLLEELDLTDNVVLDIPCGTGKLGRVLSDFPVSVIAADVSLAMMSLARDQYRPGQVTEFLECDARQMSLPDKCLDVVVCLRLFQRLPAETRQEILREFRRVGRRHLVISYSYESTFQKIRRASRRLLVRNVGSFQHVEIKQIRAEIESAGLTILKEKYVLRGLSSEVVFLAEIK